ncbi:MAG: two-component system sensor histidine kinase NtrB [Gemmatimonadaceae bacterium]
MSTKTRVAPRSVTFNEVEAHLLVTVLADIAARLTDPRPTLLVAHDVLESVCEALQATECAVWLDGDAARLVRTWSAGTEETAESEISAAVAGGLPARGLAIVEMRFGTRRVGVLVVRVRGTPSEAVNSFIAALCSMLAGFVAHSERSRRLESDLQSRMLEAEEHKRFSEEILDMLPLGLYVIDRQYRITVWNRKREIGMRGIDRKEAIGHAIFEILYRQPGDVLRREFDEVFATGRMQQFQMESNSSGTLRTYRLSKIPMRDSAGTVTHIITIGEDITDWVEARERIAQNDKLAAIGRLAAGIMHEINNPLATIAACAESMTLETTTPDGSPEYLKIIESEVHRCKRIVDGLLDFSRPRPRERQSLNVNGVVERALFLLNHHARFKQLTVDAQFAPELPTVHASSEQLIQVMIALLMNAADAMPQYGKVRIRTRIGGRNGRQVMVEVQDEGSGISRAQLTRIFEPFYTTKDPGVGTGLGLSICHGIVADHGGRIDVSSNEGEGTTFRILLPAETA